MNIKKISKTLLFGLIILLILIVIYLVIPKYQIQSVRVDENTVVVTRINTITGQVNYESNKTSSTYLNKYKE